MVEIDAYAADCRVHGQVELEEGRLSDQLNRAPELLIRDARLEGLDDGHVVEISEVTIAREELCAVVVSGPRGDVARRLHTRTTRVEVEVGPYRVEGRVHGTPASEPLGVGLAASRVGAIDRGDGDVSLWRKLTSARRWRHFL